MKRWNVHPVNPQLQKNLSDALGLHPLMAQLLINRKITTLSQARIFLSADMQALHNPFLLTDMDRAVPRIEQARKKREKVLIYGDYDVDGVTSSALLRRLFDRLGIGTINYIPHRMEEGYGLNQEIAQFAKSKGVGLIVTVDCGINAFEPVAAIKSAGMDVIIIDHHEPDGGKIPEALAVINPKRPDCLYPFKNLSAVGLVAKLTQAVLGEVPLEDLDLVALGTVADVVPLHGENRIFVKNGLPAIERTSKPGLKALLEVAKISGKRMRPHYIGFILGPRLNAAGRMDSAAVSLDLLLSDNAADAYALACNLEAHNTTRQKMQNEVIEEAMAMIEAQGLDKQEGIIIVHKEGWHKGVLGIVAARIVDKFYRPTIVISVEDGMGTGSARSINGFHLHEALANCAQFLENYGGHQRAAGLRLKYDNIEVFGRAINEFAGQVMTLEKYVPCLDIDCEVSLSIIDLGLVELIASMEPHGEGNPAPVFCSKGLLVKSPPSLLGKDTIKFWVTDGAKSLSAVGFGMGSFKEMVKPGEKIDLVYSLGIDDWNKAPCVQLVLKDIRPHA
ncbi:MAG: single-stranded-DNA-specific exonuclease RecJ [Candidatus Omnitrophica bacterium]|nr:single-stranded-DNA-specific exonuclease RecJ [Candidatus Omnitrophota bacterium]MDE2231074.1 single-stranded-DNA-specific exonuclease RecJ [Candidatus Omnitrophota bacterium]